MIYARFAHGLVSMDEGVYAIGGFCHTDIYGAATITLRSCERFLLNSGEWLEIPPMEHARAFPGLIAI